MISKLQLACDPLAMAPIVPKIINEMSVESANENSL